MRRRWLALSLLTSFLACTSLVALLASAVPDPERECFERLHEGMPDHEALAVLSEHGFRLKHFELDAGQASYGYLRAEGGRMICLTFRGDRVGYLGISDADDEGLFRRLRRRLTTW